MKMLKKMTVITIALLLVCCMVGTAAAEKIYTSPSFRIPTGRISTDDTEAPDAQEPEEELPQGEETGETADPDQTDGDEIPGDETETAPGGDENDADVPDETPGADEPEGTPDTDEQDVTPGTDEPTDVPDGTEPEGTAETDPGTDTEQEPTDDTVEEPELTAGDEAVSKGRIQIRIAPDGMSEIIGEAPDGSYLEILSVNGDWAFVLYGSLTGYVHISQLSGIVDVVKDEVEKEMKVTIFTSRKTVVTEGEPIYLTSILEGFENCTVTYQWQYDRGNGWEDISGANKESYVFSATAETLAYSWRLKVHYETQE